MSKDSDLKVIFFEPAPASGKEGSVIADGYFSFVPTFNDGDTINITRSTKGNKNAPVSNPIGHKTHRVLATDWVVTVNDATKDAVATLIVSVETLSTPATPEPFPSVVATHS